MLHCNFDIFVDIYDYTEKWCPRKGTAKITFNRLAKSLRFSSLLADHLPQGTPGDSLDVPHFRNIGKWKFIGNPRILYQKLNV